VVCGGHDPALFTSVDRIVLSPGVPPMAALDAADRAGIPWRAKIELASWFIEGTVLAITGTNGKSTVTTLVGEMCAATGRPTFVGGNLGRRMVKRSVRRPRKEDGIVVVRALQLSARAGREVTCQYCRRVLNITEDHLDRYQNFDQ